MQLKKGRYVVILLKNSGVFMLEEIDQYESPVLWVLVDENYFDNTLVRSFQADFRRRFQAPSFSTVSGHRGPRE